MDVMDIRRSLLMNMTGGSAMIGDFTRYTKQTLKFTNATNSNAWTNNPKILLPFAPKYILFYSDSKSTQGCIYAGVLTFVEKEEVILKHGFVRYINLASGTDSVSGVYSENSTQNNLCFYIDNDNYLHIDRASGNGFWSNSYNYTFEFYG